jgi:mono/diheme cytochrome c family protein
MRATALLLAALGLAVAGCGGGGGSGGEAGGETTQPATTTAATTGERRREGKGDPKAGELAFVTFGCGFCHTLSDVDANGTRGPNLDKTKPSEELVVERVTDGKGVMPSYSDDMTPQEIQDVAAYVASVAGQ